MAFFSVVAMAPWPTAVSKVIGRYLRAETMYSDIFFLVLRAKIHKKIEKTAFE
jgi:hypothetical protein